MKELKNYVPARKIQQVLSSCDRLALKKIQRAPWRTDGHCHNRLQWAKGHIIWMSSVRKRVIFSDIKRFILTVRTVSATTGTIFVMIQDSSFTREQHETPVIKCSSMSYHAFSNLAAVKENVSSPSYCNVLGNNLHPFSANIFGTNWTI